MTTCKTKKSATAATVYAPKSGKAERPATKGILSRILSVGNTLIGYGLGISLGFSIWAPVAYKSRGYFALGGEVFLIAGTAWLFYQFWRRL